MRATQILAVVQNGSTLIQEVYEGSRFTLPNGDTVSPAYAGWSSGAYRVVEIEDDGPPTGATVINTSVAMVDGKPKRVYQIEQDVITDPLDKPLDRLDFWLVAASAGISKWSVRDRIAAMPEGVEKNEAIAWFEDSPRYRRDDPLVISLAAAEGITPEQLDTLWVWAVGE